MTKPSDDLKARLREISMDLHAEDDALSDKEKACDHFVFHMTDWIDDLNRLAKFYAAPEGHSPTDAKEAVWGLLYHACGHIIEAARLYDYVPDPFGNERKKGAEGK